MMLEPVDYNELFFEFINRECIDTAKKCKDLSLDVIANVLSGAATVLPSGIGISAVALITLAKPAIGRMLGLREAAFIKKWMILLAGIDDADYIERSAFWKRLEANDEFRQDFSESLLMILDKVTEYSKIDVLVKIVMARAKEFIDEELMWELLFSIEFCLSDDLYILSKCVVALPSREFIQKEGVDDSVISRLQSAGFLCSETVGIIPSRLGIVLKMILSGDRFERTSTSVRSYFKG